MTRDQLAHILRAAALIVQDNDILVIGSQSILGSYDEDHLPPEAFASIEADIAFLNDENAEKADILEGAIGELSQFHETFKIYAQGVTVSTATLPHGWRNRVVFFPGEDAKPSMARCLDPHDLVISKLVAGRQKDIAFAFALVREGIIDPAILRERAEGLNAPRLANLINALEGPALGL